MKTSAKNFSLILACIFTISIFNSCTKSKTEWEIFEYPGINGKIYASFCESRLPNKNSRIKGVICATEGEIQGRMNISHECTEEQFSALKETVKELGGTFLGTTTEPDFKEYPDLSAYLTFVISDDELHEIWRSLKLE